ncbi:hypothetical protein NVP1121O_190 [Vibrio phage 1.121.O._10N.286.46.C4]|nr:hypothetical protein NVP1121O_190 [Vibrio phage 1.121.O._10N.286.46.C4]
MYSYECSHCGDPLCPEVCSEATIARQTWLESEEFKKLQRERRRSSNDN